LGGGQKVKLQRGTIALFNLDRPSGGHARRGLRACVVISSADVNSDLRFPFVCVAPLTSTPGRGMLYPSFAPGKNGLTKKSYALLDQLCSVHKRRAQRTFGRLAPSELLAIDEALGVFLGLGERDETVSKT
jgi:mRNA interferase MazF